MKGNNRENTTRDFDAIKETNYIGHELDTIYAKNKTDIDDLCLDIKIPLYRHDGVHNVGNGEYLKLKSYLISSNNIDLAYKKKYF